MKNHHFFSKFLILLILGAIVFFAGYMQFHVKTGNYGVMVSRTGGVYEKPIVSGNFDWRWENLIPTNADIRVFNALPYNSRQLVSGTLPSAEIYKKVISENTDFSYSATFKISLRMTPQGLVKEVKKSDLRTQQELNSILETKAAIAAKCVMEYFIANKNPSEFSPHAVTENEIKEIILNNTADFSDIEITEVTVLDARIPDLQLYRKAKDAYEVYQAELQEKLKKEAASNAKEIFEENAALERLERFGELLQKYPQLQELVKDGDVSRLLKAMKSVR